MVCTRTGAFPIGFRRMGGWQEDLGACVSFAKEWGFEFVDVKGVEVGVVREILAAGVGMGSVDLKNWGELVSPDAGRRRAAAEMNASHVRGMVEAGVRNFFTVVAPPMEESGRDRKENFGFAVDGYGRLCEAIGGTGARIVMEGYPGGWPYFPCLGCTPADCRAMLKELGEVAGINFDPSHLVRMGIDPERFLGEFGGRVYHVHGKDTELLGEGLYEHGNLQRGTFETGRRWGGNHWRYCVPGRGAVRWGRMMELLVEAGYRGGVSVELEDVDFNGTEEGERRGFVAARRYLEGV